MDDMVWLGYLVDGRLGAWSMHAPTDFTDADRSTLAGAEDRGGIVRWERCRVEDAREAIEGMGR